MSYNQKQKDIDKILEAQKRAKGILNDLLMKFDKAYVEELFNQGHQANAFGNMGYPAFIFKLNGMVYKLIQIDPKIMSAMNQVKNLRS